MSTRFNSFCSNRAPQRFVRATRRVAPTGWGPLIPPRCQPYAAIAGLYDRIMDHVNYGSWAEYISALFRRFHPGVQSVLDIACGTGSLALLLSTSGYSLTCTDLSPEMLKVASDKFRKAGLPVRFVAGSMTALPFGTPTCAEHTLGTPFTALDHPNVCNCGVPNVCNSTRWGAVTRWGPPFDAVLCIYDSINYRLEPSDFRRAVHQAASVAKKGGLFIFDVCTVKNSELFFREGSMVETCEDMTYQRICKYHSRTHIQENRFVISRNGKTLGIERHRQRIYYLDEITGMVFSTKDSPFREVGRFNDMSFYTGTEDSERVHFVFRKE